MDDRLSRLSTLSMLDKQILVIENSVESLLYWVAKFYDKFVFGGGEHWWIPTAWLIIGIPASFLYIYMQYTDWVVFFNMLSMLIDFAANLHFGYFYLKSKQLSKFMEFYRVKYSMNTNGVMNYLDRGLGVLLLIIILLVLVNGLRVFTVYQPTRLEIVYFIAVACIDIIFIGSCIYLCVVWCFQLFVIRQTIGFHLPQKILKCSNVDEESYLHETTTHSLYALTEDSITDSIAMQSNPLSFSLSERKSVETVSDGGHNRRALEKTVFNFLLEMTEFSHEWKYNHIWRLSSGLASGVSALIRILDLGHPTNLFVPMHLYIIVICYCGMIWVTAMAAGYVNDYFYHTVTRVLSRAYCEHRQISSNQDLGMVATISKLSSMHHIDGIRFAGYFMSLEKAFSIGSILISLMIVVIRYANPS